MIEWLQSIANSVFSGLNNLRDWIIRAIAAVYSYIVARIQEVARSIGDVVRWAQKWLEELGHYVDDVLHYAINIAQQIIPAITRWISDRLNDLQNFSNWLLREIRVGLDNLLHWVEQVRMIIIRWVLTEIWDPLKRLFDGFFSWVTDNFGKLFNYFAHPELIVQLVAHWLWRTWLDLLKQYSRPVARWLMAHMLGLVSEFVHLIEDIIVAVL